MAWVLYQNDYGLGGFPIRKLRFSSVLGASGGRPCSWERYLQ